MISTQSIDQIIELALYSGYLQDVKPISLLLTAPPEAGKSQSVIKFKDNKNLVLISDITAYGIVNSFGMRLKNSQIKYFIFTDLITPLSKNIDTRNSFIALLNSLIEEGLFEIHTHTMDFQEKIPKPIGIIACLAKDVLMDNKSHWSKIGFMSRLLPVSWDYTAETIEKINESIDREDYLNEKPVTLNLPDQPQKVTLNVDLAKQLRDLTRMIDRNTQDNPYGFRVNKQLHTLAKASALKDGRSEVNDNDLIRIAKLRDFMNLKYTKI